MGGSRSQGNVHLIYRLGVARADPWDDYAGSKLMLDFEIGTVENADLKNRSFRSWRFLTEAQKEEARVMQNAVIASLCMPPPERTADLQVEARAWYLGKFAPVDDANRVQGMLRYYTEAHVDAWAVYLLRLMPQFVKELEALA